MQALSEAVDRKRSAAAAAQSAAGENEGRTNGEVVGAGAEGAGEDARSATATGENADSL